MFLNKTLVERVTVAVLRRPVGLGLMRNLIKKPWAVIKVLNMNPHMLGL